ncbi:hypothetical protein HYPSUDRAFT_34079 [Hypholoma sublateritium FD-334 SS-4]|uniref:DUF292-domain-containing protein n=1 Tax=Hypholoma sublateritium (strain FD-334 SS-4) TaxID=945553 RepID=A0A0D2PCQ4_HYPSF|nr:hypothetical protein HYPSUDRAFT_34079 [Hypholoma sublateritium FD-334 SS-4]
MSSMWNAAKAKVQLRLAVQRLRTLQQKKEAQAKASRRDIALLLEKGKLETARIKVETIINEDIYVELLELMELYCELLLARFGLLDQNLREPDPGVSEGVCAVIHASQRTELKELHILRDLLMHKYGREFSLAVMENRDGCVSKRIISKLSVDTPPPALVDGYLKEIAKAYGVPFSIPGEEIVEVADEDQAVIDHNKDVKQSEDSDDVKRTEKSTEVPNAKSTSTIPSEPLKTDAKNIPASSSPPEDEFDLLSKRFAQLKKR